MIRAVLDTNVLISGSLIREGNPGQILQAWRRGEFSLFTSLPILKEVLEVSLRPHILKRYNRTPQDARSLFALLRDNALIASGTQTGHWVEVDPDDDVVVNTALEVGADYIVSGDPHLLALKEVRGILIVTPAQFLAVLEAAKKVIARKGKGD